MDASYSMLQANYNTMYYRQTSCLDIIYTNSSPNSKNISINIDFSTLKYGNGKC